MSEDAAWIRRLVETGDEHDGMISTGVETLMVSSMRSKSAVRNGFLCMLSLQGPLHFRNGSRIQLKGEHFSKFNRMEMHHIFPVSFLEEQGSPRKSVHRIPNFCFIPAKLNAWIGGKPPSMYMDQLR